MSVTTPLIAIDLTLEDGTSYRIHEGDIINGITFMKDNQEYNLTSRDDISKVVIYYLSKINDEVYYVPVTKYLNDSRDKIKIIIDELSTSYIYEPNLMSFLHSQVELLDYYEQENVLFLNFNQFLFDSDDKVLEEVLYSISYSVFDNYDVSMVMFEVNSQFVGQVSREGDMERK